MIPATASLGRGIQPEGAMTPPRDGRYEYSNWRRTDPVEPCPVFECNAPLLADVQCELAICLNGHRWIFENLYNIGVVV